MYAVKERATCGRRVSRGSRWKERQADRLTVGVCAVKLADGFACVARIDVRNESSAERAVGAVVEHFAGGKRSNAGEELLWRRQ